jgi:prophage antirepressor-like protein
MSEKNQNAKIAEYLFGENPVRVAGTALEPLFAAKDVCDVLGLQNPTVAVEKLDEDEVTKFNLGSRSGDTLFVTESGLYHLIFKSRKAAAKKFRRWVTQEVLPAVRKDGRYVVTTTAPDELPEMLNLPDWIEELEVDMVKDAWLVQLLVDRARVAALQLGYDPGKKRDSSDHISFPRPVLNYALGMVRHEAGQSPNATWIDYFPQGFLGGRERLSPPQKGARA